VFDLAIAERVLDRAVQAEDGGHHDALAVPEPFSRTGQRGGLVVGELALGAGVAFLLAGVAVFVAPRVRSPERFWGLASGAGVWGVVLLPAAVYPPAPPGAESTLGIHERQGLYLAVAAVGIGSFAAAVHVWSSTPRLRRSLGLAVALVPAALTLVLFPENRTDASALPPGLLTDFRIVSIVSQLLFWMALALAGLLLLRRQRAPS
jgi:predicted cobalt transporter CbtA